MAKPAWITVTPESGRLDGVVNGSAPSYTGRLSRSGVVTVEADDVLEPKICTITQNGKTEFAAFNLPTTTIGREGKIITVDGTSNSDALTFAFEGESYEAVIDSQYRINAETDVNNGENIPNDPGASSQYDFLVTLVIPENTTINPVVRTLKVTTKSGATATYIITQEKNDAYLTIAPTEITLEAEGGEFEITINSNTTWKVS